MMETETFERFPLRIVLLSVGVALAIYALGASLLGQLHGLLAAAYLLYACGVEVSVMRGSCIHCYYYGKRCGLGKGWLCARLFRQGDPARFAQRTASWRDLLPDMLILLFPLAGGVVLLLQAFSWLWVVLLLALVALSLGGNAVVRGSFACKYCKQRELGCPAQALFAGKET